MTHSVLLIGCGNMGFAMLAGWLEHDPGLQVHVVEPNSDAHDRARNLGAIPVGSVDELPAGLSPDLIFLAVKPQIMVPVLAQCSSLATGGATFVSIAAGITLQTLETHLPDGTPVIRCMPNTPAAIGMGMMVLVASPRVEEAAKSLTENLLATGGSVAWIDDDSLMDAVTAISGSGPAYFFHFVEALTHAGIALGLPEDTASLLARQTAAGAGQMTLSSETPPSTLREQVTSPGGTTAAALSVFMENETLTQLVLKATTAARDRGIELGK